MESPRARDLQLSSQPSQPSPLLEQVPQSVHIEHLPNNSWIKKFPDNQDLDRPKRWYCSPHYVQELILLYGQKKSYFPLQLLVGPDWRGLCGTFLAIIVPTVFFIAFICENISRYMTYAAIALFVFVLGALAMTGFTDPGIIFHREYEIDPETAESYRVIECAQCRVKRPHTARHCYRCGVCVDGLDHHCPFVGKCIGKKNLMFFYAFVGSVYLHTYFVFGTTAYYLIFVLMVPAIKRSLHH